MIMPGDASGKVELDSQGFGGGGGGGYQTGGDGGNIHAGAVLAEVNGQVVVEADGGQGQRYTDRPPVELEGWRGGAR